MENNIKITDLGYNDFFESNRKKLGLDTFKIARVTSEYQGLYKALNENGEYLAKITGKQLLNATSREDFPAVGDWVAITELDNGQAIIHSVLPRATILERKQSDRSRLGEKNKTQIIATNIDVALIVESVDRDYSLNRLERYLSIAKNRNIVPVIILNKVDLISKEELDSKLIQIKNRLDGVDIIPTSTTNKEGLDELIRFITKGKTYCFLGSSGVGKSSLINYLLGDSTIKTGVISSYSGRGRHITTNRQMYLLKRGGIVIDNPGIREVGITDVTTGIDSAFSEIAVLSRECKFVDCTHTHEPGCKVLSALEKGKIDKEQYSNYVSLKKEAEHFDMNSSEKREKDRQFGKFIKRAKKEIKTYKDK